MHEIILCKLGEVVLKGLNRRSFEMKLMSNIRRRTQRFGKWKIYSRQSTIYVEPAEAAAGGLPLGMGGHAVSLLSGGIDSPVSSYMIAKRGVQLEMIHFASPPYTS